MPPTNPSLTQLEKLKGNLSPGEYAGVNDGTPSMTPLEKAKGNLSPGEYGQYKAMNGVGQNPNPPVAGMPDRAFGTGKPADIRFPGSATGSAPAWSGAGLPMNDGNAGPVKNAMAARQSIGFPAAGYTPGSVASSPLALGTGSSPLATTPNQGGNPSAIVPRQAGSLGPVQAGEIPSGGKIVGLSPKGMAVAGGALTAANVINEMAPRDPGETYGGQVANNLRDTFSRMSTGAGIGGTIGSVVPVVGNVVGTGLGAAAGGLYDIGKKIYDGGKDLLELPRALMGAHESGQALKKTTQTLNNEIKAHPENVTQSTYDSLATANRQIARNDNAPIPAGVPATGNIVNAPVPQGMPAPVPMSQLPGAKEAAAAAAPAAPAAPKQFQGPSAEEMAAFRKQTGTKFDPKSVNDKLSLERMRAGEETFDSKQANAYRAAHKDYRPGMYTRS